MSGIQSPKRKRPVLAITLGDPAGIGPEITARLFAEFTPDRSVPVFVGAPSAFGPWLERAGLIAGRDYRTTADPEAAIVEAGKPGGFVILDTGVDERFTAGKDCPGGGAHAGTAIKHACELANNLSVDGIVTAPISKNSLNLAGFRFSGHTEMLAQYLKAPDCQMMMVVGGLRVVPLTRHVPLADVAGRIDVNSIVSCVRVVASALVTDFGIDSPRIAVAGLNPHAGDGGVIGDEEIRVITPALEQLRADGIEVDGPVPADALFPQAVRDFRNDPDGRGRYDTYISMYHDQGLAPFKMLSQRHGVNVTVGLPIVRTSVDHGVAYEVAGRGTAETESLLAAYKLAEEMSIRRAERRKSERSC